MKAEVVYFYAYDVGGELLTERMSELLGRPLAPLPVEPHKRQPVGSFFYRPLTAMLEPLERRTGRGPLTLRIAVRLLPVGAISIMFRAAVECDALEELLAYYDLRFVDGTLDQEVQALASRIAQAVRPYLVRPIERLRGPEAYTVFCLEPPAEGSADMGPWFQQQRRRIAALLTQEQDASRLSEHEVQESTQYHYSYYAGDLVVVDWDAAFVVDDQRAFDELLNVCEVANLQLEELKEYDRLLDAALGSAYDDLLGRPRRRPRGRRQIQRELREMRIDLARVRDELTNITKFFGDWHVARIYEALARRFHLDEWETNIDQKVRTLESIYNLLQQERTNRWMLVLETAIVGLFLLDLAALFLWH